MPQSVVVENYAIVQKLKAAAGFPKDLWIGTE